MNDASFFYICAKNMKKKQYVSTFLMLLLNFSVQH